MISKKILKNLIDEKTYDNIKWEYDTNLIQIIKEKETTDGKVYNLKYNNLKDKYDIMIVIKKDYFKGYCNCKIGKEGKNCEHLIWSGIKINEINKKNQIKIDNNIDYLSFFQKIINQEEREDKLNISLKFSLNNENTINYQIYANINKQKEYKINNVKTFINIVQNKQPINLGKELQTQKYKITEQSKKIIDLLDYTNYKYKDKENQNIIYELINLYQFQYIEYNQEEYYVTNFFDGIKINIETKEKQIQLNLEKQNKFQFINKNIIIDQTLKTFYLIDKKEEEKIKIINQISKINNKINFNEKESKKFITQILPQLYNEFNFNLDPNLNLKIIEEKLTITLYCYMENKQIKIKPIFKYGDYEANNQYENILIKRNTIKENELINTLKYQGYQYDPYYQEFYIDVQKSQFLFLTKNIFNLKQDYEVNLDEKLKKAILNFDANKINISITGNEKLDYFELNYELKEIPDTEINNIIKAFEENKEYYIINDEQFLKLNDKKVYEQLLFLKNVVQDKTSKMNRHRIPKYKALIMQEEIKNKFNKYQFNQSFINYIEYIQQIEEINDDKFNQYNYKLRGYQKEGISWLNTMYESEFGALLADEMGLGKTLQVISFLEIKNIQNGLIIVPKALLYNWQEEFKKFNKQQQIQIIEGTATNREKIINDIQKDIIYITSYNSIVQDYELYQKQQFDTIVIDEAQYIKNPQTKTAKCTKMLKGKFYIALTGTPIENNLLELWSIFDFTIPGYLGDLNTFKKKYKIEKENELKILQKSIQPFMKRRLKSEVLKELPSKVESNIYCNMEEEQKKIYYAFNEKIKKDLTKYKKDDNINKKSFEILAAITKLRQIAIDPALINDNYDLNSSKIEVLNELVDEILENKDKVLIFSQYTTLLKKIAKKYSKEGQKYYYLDGETKPKDRLINVEKFNKSKTGIFLISLKAGGVGLNLTSANNVIILDPWWNPAVENQAIDRAHRIGQKNTVNVYRIITKDTIEEKIQILKNIKSEISQKILTADSDDKALQKLSTEEIINLLI